MQEHWHLRVNPDEEDPFVDIMLYAVLDTAVDDLRELVSYHYQGISALGDSGMYKQAYESFKTYEKIEALRSSAENVVKQHKTTIRNDRAPLYRNWHIDQQNGDWGDSSKLWQTAQWVAGRINDETSLEIYSCTADDIIGDENGIWHESYNPSGG